MGLDTTHECWHGSCSAFNRWRDKLAAVAGYTFHVQVEGRDWNDPVRQPGFITGRLLVDVDWGNIEATIGRDLFGKWEKIPVRPDGTPDPLIILMAHSDCEGILQKEFLTPIADRLEELLPLLADEEGGGHIGLYADKTRQFIKGLRLAAKRNENVGFH